MTATDDLAGRCELLRSLHRPGTPLVLPNAWDVASARAVVAAGFPVVATTSGGVAATLGYEDHEGAPASEMLAAAARISRGVDVPVTVDAEGGYGMEPAELVAALRDAGAAGCNLEDSDHARGTLRDPAEQAGPLADFIGQASAPVNVLETPRAPSLTELTDLGVARVSWGSLLHRQAMGQLAGLLASLTTA